MLDRSASAQPYSQDVCCERLSAHCTAPLLGWGLSSDFYLLISKPFCRFTAVFTVIVLLRHPPAESQPDSAGTRGPGPEAAKQLRTMVLSSCWFVVYSPYNQYFLNQSTFLMAVLLFSMVSLNSSLPTPHLLHPAALWMLCLSIPVLLWLPSFSPRSRRHRSPQPQHASRLSAVCIAAAAW